MPWTRLIIHPMALVALVALTSCRTGRVESVDTGRRTHRIPQMYRAGPRVVTFMTPVYNPAYEKVSDQKLLEMLKGRILAENEIGRFPDDAYELYSAAYLRHIQSLYWGGELTPPDDKRAFEPDAAAATTYPLNSLLLDLMNQANTQVVITAYQLLYESFYTGDVEIARQCVRDAESENEQIRAYARLLVCRYYGLRFCLVNATFLDQSFSFKGADVDFKEIKPFLTDLLYVRTKFSDTIPEARDTSQAFMNDEHLKLYEALVAEIPYKDEPDETDESEAVNRGKPGAP